MTNHVYERGEYCRCDRRRCVIKAYRWYGVPLLGGYQAVLLYDLETERELWAYAHDVEPEPRVVAVGNGGIRLVCIEGERIAP